LEPGAPFSPKRMPIGRQSSFLDFHNFKEYSDQGRTKNEVLMTVIFCAIGLNVSFLIWGVLQERMLTMPYNDGEYFTYSYGLVFSSRLGGLILSFLLVYFFEKDAMKKATAPLYEYSYPSVSNMLSSWCQYEALQYISFPTQMLSKSFKIVPIMIMGTLISNKTYEIYEFVVAALIAVGNTIFMVASEDIHIGYNTFGQVESSGGTTCGILLLLLYLCFDSFTSQYQTKMFTKYRNISPLVMMLYTNIFSTVFAFITLVHTDELQPAFDFVKNHPSIHFHFIMFAITSTVGQLFIFFTIKNFGAVVFAIIMSTRILASILLSCFIYSHPVTPMGYVGLTTVFLSIGYRIKRKTEGQNILQWEGVDESEGPILMKEWHEHVDM